MKKTGWVFLVIFIIYLVINAPLISYLLMQGQGQLEVLWNAKPLTLFLEETDNDELRSKLLLVDEIKYFASTQLGLQSDGLYTTIYDQEDHDILWNLTACEPYSLKSVEWKFPIVGTVSYKGFFDLDKAKYEEQILKEKGYDTRIRPVNAWSTLGWFSDPILSNNLKREEGTITELFIHEITHANIFIKDSLTFNENLASFIGEQGALLFLIDKYGVNSKIETSYRKSEADNRLFVNHCLKGVEELRQLYADFDISYSEKSKSERKEAYMRKWVAELDSLPFSNQKHFGRFNDKLPNNAFFMAFERYDSQKENFSIQLDRDFEGNLSAFIKYYKRSCEDL